MTHRPDNPYPGLRSFRRDERSIFFGRDRQIADLEDRLASRNVVAVLGGSGSGKSSLVRAGLIPRLGTSAALGSRGGAWYVVEFRPGQRPSEQLVSGILNFIQESVLRIPDPIRVDGAAAVKPGEQTPEPVAGASQATGLAPELVPPVSEEHPCDERTFRVGVLSEVFRLDLRPDTADDEILRQCRLEIEKILLRNGVAEVNAILGFARNSLNMIDRALARGAQITPPNLLLLIDQFEELFNDDVPERDRDMVLSLVVNVFRFKPRRLSVVLTMRSEELHRCSEFPGLPDVINGSAYLVDLVDQTDIAKAIFEPARKALAKAGLPVGGYDTAPFSPEVIDKLKAIYAEGKHDLPNAADQLPLTQHLVRELWSTIDDSRFRPDKELEIVIADLQAVPGVSKPEGALRGCLEKHAEACKEEALNRVREICPGLDMRDFEGLMQVAFCTMVQLDNRGNVKRDFATLDEMMRASGVVCRSEARVGNPHQSPPVLDAVLSVMRVDRRPEYLKPTMDLSSPNQLREGLKRTLEVFEEEVLIAIIKEESVEKYTVYHEAFIRCWGDYRTWVRRMRDVENALIRTAQAAKWREGQSASPLHKVVGILLGSRQRDAYNLLVDRLEALALALGPRAIFSATWADDVLQRYEKTESDLKEQMT